MNNCVFRLVVFACAAVLVTSVLVSAATPCGERTDAGAKSCPGGKITLTSTYCLGVTWSPCAIGWLNKVQFDASVATSIVLGCDEADSNNIDFCKVRVDGDNTWYDIFNVDKYFNIGSGTHTLLFWSRAASPPTDPTVDGTTVVFIMNDSKRRFLSWMNVAKPSGAPADGSCPDAACP